MCLLTHYGHTSFSGLLINVPTSFFVRGHRRIYATFYNAYVTMYAISRTDFS